jgi:integrase
MGAESPRTRRLQSSEEEQLLQHAPPFLRALIVAALSTGCRVGELLSIQWSQIRRDASGVARWIVLAAEDTKTNESRSIPIGPRLRGELDMRRHAPDGREHLADGYVFGNDVGDKVEFLRSPG